MKLNLKNYESGIQKVTENIRKNKKDQHFNDGFGSLINLPNGKSDLRNSIFDRESGT